MPAHYLSQDCSHLLIIKDTRMRRIGLAGFMRGCFPRGTDFADLCANEIERVILRMIYRPRKCRGFSSPEMVFCQEMKFSLNT